MTGHRSTRTHHRAPWMLGMALAGVVSLPACGHGVLRTTAVATDTPAQAVTRAVGALAAEPFRMRATQAVHMDLSGMPADAQADPPPMSGIPQTISGAVESPQRFSGTFTSGDHAPVRVVVYDGTGYASGDGSTWREAPFLGELVAQFGFEQLENITRQMTAVHDAGSVRVDGIEAERYDATFPASAIIDLGRQAATGMSGALGVPASIIDATIAGLHVNAFTIGFEIARTSGRLVAAVGSVDASIDMARVAAAMGITGSTVPTGTMRLLMSSDARITDEGAHIVVHRPTSGGTMTAQQFGALLTSGGAQ